MRAGHILLSYELLYRTGGCIFCVKNIFWFMVSVGLCISSVQAASILSGPVYNPATTHTYFLLTTSDWTDAEAAAASMGAHLVTVNDAAENDWLLSTFSNFGGQARALWTGLTDAGHEGTFVWTSGEPVSYTHWEAGQPDDGGDFYPHEDYVLIWPSPGPRSPGYWNDYINTNDFPDLSLQLYGVVEVPGGNYWTNPFSAKWESLSWSLGTLPASNQMVYIANDGYKAVDIDAATFVNFPASLTVSNLFVGAPTNALSTLLLNYAGLDAPLKVLNNCTVGSNGMIDNFSSSFEVDGNAGGELRVDGGTFTQVGGLTVANAPVFVPNGSFNTTNANLTLGQVTVGSGFGNPNPYAPDAVFTQDGGSIAAQSVDIEQGGTYHLVSGVLYGINGTRCSGGPFVQYGGTNYGNISQTGHYYWLRNGMVQGNVLTVANNNEFVQDAGLLDMEFINVSGTTNWPVYGGPFFNGGIVHCGTLNIGANGKVEQQGGDFFVTNNFDLHGMEFIVGEAGPVIEHAGFTLSGGNLYLPSMSLGQYAFFDQTAGSNEISGGLSLFGGQLNLYGGTLETTYTGVGAAATFVHGGGQNFIHGVLSITGTYTLNGVIFEGGSCNVVCQGLYLRGALIMKFTFDGRGFDTLATFTNTGVLNLGGTISTELPDVELGQVQLATNASIAFGDSYFRPLVRFANSSAVGWIAGALLTITNWSSSDHVFAGSDASGLTASQLAQIQFSNPAGFSLGNYGARLLSTGEIVPAGQPTLQSARYGSALVLTWPTGFQLLSATNVSGPYTPVSGATSPWTNLFSKPQEFFRVQ